MSDAFDVASEALQLIEVATSEWLRARSATSARENHLQEERAKHAGRLRLIVGAHARLAEVDAQLAIIEVTPELPAHDEIRAKLRKIRSELARSLRREQR